MLRSLRKALTNVISGRRRQTWRGGKRGFARHRRLLQETLEPRLVLDAGPLITEFMAVNNSTLADVDGDDSDWIEIYNPTDETVDLDGWYLTDDVDTLSKWRFPAVNLGARQYLVVFASSKNRQDPAAQLHTNFKLGGGGEYLALVEPDGVTIGHAYAPEYPAQIDDVSYGLGAPAPGMQMLVAAGLGGSTVDPASPLQVGIYDGTSSNMASADARIASGPPDATLTVALADFFDSGGSQLFTVNNNLNVPGGRDTYAVVVTGFMNVVTPGNYRFGTLSDDNSRIRIDLDQDGVLEGNLTSLGGGEAGGGGTVVWQGACCGLVEGPAVPLATGLYKFEAIYTEGGGGDYGEFFYTPAALTTNATNSALLGDDRQGIRFDTGGTTASYHVPTAGEDVLAWTAPGYDDSTWTGPATTGLGFSDNNPNFDDLIGTDVESDMLGVNASLWVRMEFQAADPTVFDQLILRMKYDDGFVAYLNGAEVARRNAPETLAYDSAASDAHDDADAIVFEDIDLSDFLPMLRADDNVLAIHGLNATAADDDFLILPEVTAERNAKSPGYMVTATPGTANVDGALGFVEDTQFSLDRGFYDTPQVAAIYTETDGATIMYTVDGSAPSESHGTPYTGPITIDTTTTLRALAFKPGFEPSNVDTHTYIFLDDVILQDGTGFPDYWGVYHGGNNQGQPLPANYDMSPDVVFDSRYIDTIKDDLRSIPTMSLVMARDDLWDDATGIYTNSNLQGAAWERAVSVELIDTDGSTLFQVDAGIRVHGGAGRYNHINSKHSFRLLFKDDYGPTKLDYPLFTADDPDADDSFDTLVLRAGFNDQWRGGTATYIQDRWAAETQNRNGGYAPHGAWVHLYVDGLYWGLYNPVERPNADFAASYFGGNKEDYDAYRTGGLIDGNATAWNQLFSLVRAPTIDYAAVGQMLDITSYIDYMIVNQFGGNRDWPHNNWYASRYRDNGKWYFHMWDAEFSLQSLATNHINVDYGGSANAGEIFEKLITLPEFRMKYADRIHRLLFNGGLLTPEGNIATANSIVEEIDRAIVGESARWGDGAFDTHNPDRTRDDHWLPRINWLRDTYFPQRTNIVLDQFRNMTLYPPLYPDIEAPTYSQHGGHILPTDTVTVSAPAGTIYYTLDGTDPRLEGGALSPTALAITSGSAVPIPESAVVKTRVLDGGGEWSALNEATFLVDNASGVHKLAVTEINYNPYGPTPAELAVNAAFTAGDFEFVELQYQGAAPITLAGAQFVDGITFDFSTAPGVTVDPGGYVVVVSNPQAFAARYDTAGMTVFGPFTGSLSNGGEQLTLVDGVGEPIVDLEYNDSGSWPGRADGRGSSLSVIDTGGDYNDSENWRSSTEVGGSPGAAGTDRVVDVVINEVLSHTDLPDLDAIELHNTTGGEVNVGGWYLTDSSSNFWKFEIPADTKIPAYEYLVFDESHFNSSGGIDPNDFALDAAHGDEVRLLAADLPGKLRFADHVEFGAAANGESFGRWPNAIGDLYPMVTPTLGLANSGPRVGPLIISEVMYHPPPPTVEALAIYPALTENDLQFIEIYNPTSQPVPLTDWRIRKGIDFDFEPGTVIDPDEAIAIVSFNPELTDAASQLVNADREAAFRNHYAVDASARLIGAFSGELDNGGERVQLQRPDEPPLEEPDFIPRLLEDEALYDDADPWPSEADGGEQSLSRDRPTQWGHDAGSWLGTPPTPGDASLKVFIVTGLTPTIRGFVATFDREIRPDELNLYDSQNGILGAADVTLVGNSVGPVAGSLFIDTQSVTFVARGGPLPADTYTVTLRSGPDGFQGMTPGELLDGDGNGTGGDDYVGTFTPAAVESVVFSLPDFMRGPGQSVNVPATPETGLPIHINEADGVAKIDVVLIYDPNFLEITGVNLGPNMPAEATAQLNWDVPRDQLRWVSMSFRTSGDPDPPPLPAGSADVMNIIARVPATAPLGAAQALDYLVVQVNDGAIAVTTPKSVQAVGFLGDTTGNQSYSGLDAQRAARVAVHLDSGFSAYPNIDPVIVADVTGNGNLSGLDAQRIALEAVGLGTGEIPPLPQALRLAVPT